MGRVRALLFVAGAALLGATACAPPPGGGGGTPPTSTTARASKVTSGESGSAVVSRNGRYVVFLSSTTDAGLGADGNGTGLDAFRWDRTTDTVARASGGNGPVSSATVADNGSVAFASTATNIAGVDGNGAGSDVFLWNGASTSRVTAAAGASDSPVISSDGTKIALHSYSDLPGTAGGGGAFLYSVGGGTFTTLLTDGVGVNALPRSVSTTAAYVAIDHGGILKLVDVAASTTSLVASPTFTPPFTYQAPLAGVHAVADDGDVVYTSVIFTVSGTPSLVSGTINRWDRATATTSGITSSNVPVFVGQSSDGRYVSITESTAGTAFSPDVLGTVRMLDRQTNTSSTVSTAASSESISDTGRYVAFNSTRSDLNPPDPNGTGRDAFLWDRGA